MIEFEQYKQDRLKELEQLKAQCLEIKGDLEALKRILDRTPTLFIIYLLPKKYEDKYYTEPDRTKTYLGWKFFVVVWLKEVIINLNRKEVMIYERYRMLSK